MVERVRTAPARSILGRILAFFGVSAFCGVLLAALLVPAAGSGGAVMAAGSDILEEFPAELREAPLSQPSTIRAADGTEIARFFTENRTSVSIEEISEEMRNAIIVAIEDERFYEHNGTDVQALTRAAVNNLTSESTQGGSTLTHQYVSLLQLNADALEGRADLVMGGTTSVADRIQEARVAAALEDEMTKDEILAGYLNIVLFGGQNYGVEAAARYFWNIPASDLDAAQAALLAGMVQSPNYYDPLTNPEAALERRDVVLGTMLRNDSAGEAYGAVATLTSIDPGTGDILAMAQSTEYNPDDGGAEDRTTVNYNVDQESGGFPVGSSNSASPLKAEPTTSGSSLMSPRTWSGR